MPYARLDDRYDDHKKIRKALRKEPAAVALHAMAIAYANRHVTDGEVDSDWVHDKLLQMPYRTQQKQNIINVLLDLKMFEIKDAETFVIHDFLDWNLSREQRKTLANQGRRGGQAKSARSSKGLSKGSSNGLSEGYSEGLSEGSSTPTPTPTVKSSLREDETSSLRSDVVECFDYWRERCGHPNAKLDASRRRRVEARLREKYSVADVRLAVDGAARGAFIGDGGKRFDDLELICRSGAKLEDFMGRASASSGGSQHLPEHLRPSEEWQRQVAAHLEAQKQDEEEAA